VLDVLNLLFRDIWKKKFDTNQLKSAALKEISANIQLLKEISGRLERLKEQLILREYIQESLVHLGYVYFQRRNLENIVNNGIYVDIFDDISLRKIKDFLMLTSPDVEREVHNLFKLRIAQINSGGVKLSHPNPSVPGGYVDEFRFADSLRIDLVREINGLSKMFDDSIESLQSVLDVIGK
jgi:hypothetical protein